MNMDNSQWFHFFTSAAEILGSGDYRTEYSHSWCAWTTFGRLKEDAGYWTCGLPSSSQIFATHIGDSGIWGQPFQYSQLAHIILPSVFTWEAEPGPNWETGTKQQNIKALSLRLHELNVPHRLTDLVLEIKCY
jgi:hypothetical protein